MNALASVAAMILILAITGLAIAMMMRDNAVHCPNCRKRHAQKLDESPLWAGYRCGHCGFKFIREKH
jgi:transposase-like protein